MLDTDEFDYFPLKDGVYPASSVKMVRMSTLPSEHKDHFQIDRWYDLFLKNKEECRKEDLPRYYQTKPGVSRAPIIKFIIQKLIAEYPHMFEWVSNVNKLWCKRRLEFLEFDEEYNLISDEDLFNNKSRYVDAFDALAMQVPEDLLICSLDENENDFISSAHLMAPAEWSAEWVIGKSFAQIHEGVKRADGTHVIKNPSGMVKGVIRMPEPVQRVGAISFRSDTVLNLHPEKSVKNKWTWDAEQQVFLRFERQTVTPFPEINSFLFTVKGYWANLLHPKRIDAAIQAIENGNPNAYYRSFLEKESNNLLKFLKERRQNDQIYR